MSKTNARATGSGKSTRATTAPKLAAQRTRQNGNPGPSLGHTPKAWTFLTNHAHVLILLYAEPGLVMREVAQRVGITERAVQRIVQDLEEQGFVRRRKVGRKNEYEVLTKKALRHPIESHRNIGDLIRLITG